MGQDDNLATSLAHVVLGCVASRGISGGISGRAYSVPGMHANFIIHSVLGFLHYQSGLFNNDFKTAYVISYKATKYLALPCLMADVYRGNQNLSIIHLVSGLIPFTLMLAGNDNEHLGNLVIAVNIISLCHYSLQNNSEPGWCTAAGGILAYFMSHQISSKAIYPLCLALMETFAYRLSSQGVGPPRPPQRGPPR